MKSPYHVGAAVAAFVFDKQGRTIVQQRIGSHGANTWCPPGGKIDYGETPKEAIVREVKEETDLDITDVEFIGFTNDIFEADQLHYLTLWYAARADGMAKITEPNKCIGLEWHSVDSMPKPLFLPTETIVHDRIARKKIEAYMKEHCK